MSFRNTSRALLPFAERSHVAVWEWVQRFDPKQVYPCKRIAAFLIDERQLQIGSTESWVLNNRLILSFTGSDLALIIILEFSMKGEEEH